MLICAPVMALKSGARRCSGSAICGPVKVMMLTSTPSNLAGRLCRAGHETERGDARKRREDRLLAE